MSERGPSLRLLRAGALALTTTLAVLVPSAAQANSYVRPDATRDVVSFDQYSDAEPRRAGPRGG